MTVPAGRGRGARGTPPAVLLWGAAAAAAAVLLGFFRVSDGDVFWHLEYGRAILGTGRIPDANLFSSLFPDRPWFNPEWGFDLLLALAYRAGGWGGVAAFKALLAVLLAALLYAGLLLARRDPFSASALAVAALAAMRSRLTERPQLVSIILLAAVMLVVERHRRSGGRLLWVLPPLFAVWSNLHPELLLGILYLGGAAAGEALNGRRKAAGRLALAAILGLAAGLANPGGWLVLRHPFPHFGQDEVVRVQEFIPADPRLVPLFWLLAILSAAAVARSRERDWTEILTLAGLLLLAGRYVREVPYAALAAVLALQRRLPALLPSPRLRRSLLAAAALLALAWAFRGDRVLAYRWGWGVDERVFPAAAADFLLRHDLPGNLYNHYNQGGYLIHRLHPRRGVFQDSRVSAYPEEFLRRLHARHPGDDWSRLLQEYGVNTALVRTAEADIFFPRAGWGLVYWDDDFALLVRRTPAAAGLLERLEYRRFTPRYREELRTMGPVALEELAAEMGRSAGERRPHAALVRDRGIILGRLGRYAEAETLLRRATALDPRDADSWAFLARALEARGKAEEAGRADKEAARLRQ